MPRWGLTAQSTHPLDDEIHIAVEGDHGLIAGSNPRSVLMAVYRYLWALGCRWLRPGPEGEFIPHADPAAVDVHLHEIPAYRHRAVCIEGAVSLENVLDMVDWLPKLGLSGYFMQFREGFTFFDRWYRHQNNPLKTPQAFSVEQAREFTRQMEEELQKRGLVYHAIGHGWTCEAFGVPCLGWDQEPGRLWPPEFLSIVAEVNGKRSRAVGYRLHRRAVLLRPGSAAETGRLRGRIRRRPPADRPAARLAGRRVQQQM